MRNQSVKSSKESKYNQISIEISPERKVPYINNQQWEKLSSQRKNNRKGGRHSFLRLQLISLTKSAIKHLKETLQKIRYFPFQCTDRQYFDYILINSDCITTDMDPFIILRAYPSLQASVSSPSFKVRKPTTHSWTRQENSLYLSFLKENMEMVDSRQQRKSNKIFNLMAQKIRTRRPTQVKSHHQKLVGKYGTAENIVRHIGYLYKIQEDDLVALKQKDQNNESNTQDPAPVQYIPLSEFTCEQLDGPIRLNSKFHFQESQDYMKDFDFEAYFF